MSGSMPCGRWLHMVDRVGMHDPDEHGRHGRQPQLPPGLYELLLTDRTADAVASLGDRGLIGALAAEDAPGALAQHVAAVLRRSLAAPSFAGNLEQQIALCNELIRAVEARGALATRSHRRSCCWLSWPRRVAALVRPK